MDNNLLNYTYSVLTHAFLFGKPSFDTITNTLVISAATAATAISFLHNKIHLLTSCKAIKNKSNETRQHRTQNLDKAYTT